MLPDHSLVCLAFYVHIEPCTAVTLELLRQTCHQTSAQSHSGCRCSHGCENDTIRTQARCNVSIPARLESILEPPDYRTSDLRVPDSGLGPLGPLGPPHFGSGNLGSITHVVHEAYSTYSVVVRSNIVFFPPTSATEVVRAPPRAAELSRHAPRRLRPA